MYHHEHAIMVHASTYFHVDNMQHASNYPSGSLNSSKDLLNVIAYLQNSSSNHTFDTHHLCDRLKTLYPTLANHFYHQFYSSDIIQPIPPIFFLWMEFKLQVQTLQQLNTMLIIIPFILLLPLLIQLLQCTIFPFQKKTLLMTTQVVLLHLHIFLL